MHSSHCLVLGTLISYTQLIELVRGPSYVIVLCGWYIIHSLCNWCTSPHFDVC